MKIYLPVWIKFLISSVFALLWFVASTWLSYPWLIDLSKIIGYFLAVFVVLFLALIPGYINAFIATALLFDERPKAKALTHFPDVNILLPVYNDGDVVQSTVESLIKQNYGGKISIILINDGSTDKTVHILETLDSRYHQIQFINLKKKYWKSRCIK